MATLVLAAIASWLLAVGERAANEYLVVGVALTVTGTLGGLIPTLYRRRDPRRDVVRVARVLARRAVVDPYAREELAAAQAEITAARAHEVAARAHALRALERKGADHLRATSGDAPAQKGSSQDLYVTVFSGPSLHALRAWVAGLLTLLSIGVIVAGAFSSKPLIGIVVVLPLLALVVLPSVVLLSGTIRIRFRTDDLPQIPFEDVESGGEAPASTSRTGREY